MGYYLGIDLGSTTSKAVLVDGEGRVLGRGLTNTRSNYDVAAAVARREAVTDAHFSLLERSLEREAGERAHALSAAFRRACGVTQALFRLAALRERSVELALAAPDGGEAPAERIRTLYVAMEKDADALFGPLATDRSRFFRDVVGTRFLGDAETAAQRREVSFELAAGVYDRAIVEVENAESDEGLDQLFDHALGLTRLPQGGHGAIEKAWRSLDHDALKIERMVGTGYGRQRLPFPKDQIRSEILCHGLGANALFPNTRTVLDIGGQDTKAIQLDGEGLVTSFQMNDRCAAGCGRYLGYIADEMNLGVHELGPLALEAARPAKITSTCTVFAGVELRELLSLGERRENILLGLHRAIILRAMSLLARSGGVKDELTFTGGVAKNPAAVQELRTLVAKHYGERTINIHPDSIYTGALGAALFALRGGEPAEA